MMDKLVQFTQEVPDEVQYELIRWLHDMVDSFNPNTVTCEWYCWAYDNKQELYELYCPLL